MKIINKNQIMALFGIGILFFLSFQCVSASEITPKKVIELVNASRIMNNLDPLIENEKLSSAAAKKVQDMIANDYFAHTSPQKITPWYWFKNAGYDYKYAGENLAENFLSAEKQHQAWMDSRTHKENILNRNFKEIGAAVVKRNIGGDDSFIAVQFFGTTFKGLVGNKPAAEKKIPIAAGEENDKNAETSAIFGNNPAAISSEKNKSPIDVWKRPEPSPNGASSIELVGYIAFNLFILSSFSGFLLISLREFQRAIDILRKVYFSPMTYAPVRLDEFKKNVDSCWVDIKKAPT